MFTSHGHQIPGTTADSRPANLMVARCGGIGLCGQCSREALQNTNVQTGAVSDPYPAAEETAFDKARRIVYTHVKDNLEKTDTHVTFEPDEVYVVWFAFVLGNWKVLISTTLSDGMYYEVTYNKEKHETYLDAYKKFQNVRFPD